LEALRQDFLPYFDAIRHSLAAIRGEALTDKSRDELDCIERMLCRFQAERSYLTEHLSDVEAAFHRLEAKLERLASEPALQDYLAALSALRANLPRQPEAALDARRRLHQRHMPDLSAMAGEAGGAAQEILDDLLEIEGSQAAAVEALRARHAASVAVLSEPLEPRDKAPYATVDAGRLQTYLREAFPHDRDLRVELLQNLPGGRSKETTLVTISAAKTLPEQFVMRRDVEGGLVPSRAADEFAIIEVVARHGGVPVPAPLHCEADPTKLGGTFILVEAVPGRIEGDYFPEVNDRLTDKREVGRQLARILAQLHRIPLAEYRSSHLDTEADLGELVRRAIEATYAQATSFDTPSRVHIEIAYRWLRQNLALAEDRNPCLIHCDVGLHNMLIDGGRITALLDWELACVASPAREIAKILHLIDYLMPRDEFIAEYIAHGGPSGACEPDRLKFYAIMNYMITNQRARYANHLFFTGKQPGLVMAHAGYELYARGVRLLSNVLSGTRTGLATSPAGALQPVGQ